MNATMLATIQTGLGVAAKKGHLDGSFRATDRTTDVVIEFRTDYGSVRDITTALIYAMDELKKLGFKTDLAYKALIVSEA